MLPALSAYWNPAWNPRLLFWLVPPYQSIEQAMPLVLSAEQRRHAEPRAGHHRLRGVVGSGKTHVIAHRAAKLASEGLRVLVVCYNITLRNYIEDMLKHTPYSFHWENIEINHFDGLCWDLLNKASVELQEKDPVGGDYYYDTEVPKAVEAILPELAPEPYDAILIDEGQGFSPTWYHLLSRLLSPRNELLLVCDKKQNIYGRELSWVEGSIKGMKTQFRGAWAELTTIYRLSEDIAALADLFAETFGLNQELKTKHVQQPQLSDRQYRPEWHWYNIAREDWQAGVWGCVQTLFDAQESPSDIVVMLPDHDIGMQAATAFEKRAIHINHIFADTRKAARGKKQTFFMGDGRLKMSTIHSFKGWESLNVVLYIPESLGDAQKMDALVYTAMTRARQKLLVLNAHARYSALGDAPKHFAAPPALAPDTAVESRIFEASHPKRLPTRLYQAENGSETAEF